MSIFGEPTIGQSYRINFTDIDGNALSTADGHITSVVLISKANVDEAHTVGDRNPDFCLGDPTCRMITVVAFETKHSKLVRALFTSFMRRRSIQNRSSFKPATIDFRSCETPVRTFSPLPISKLRLQRSSIQSRVAALFHVFVFRKKWRTHQAVERCSKRGRVGRRSKTRLILPHVRTDLVQPSGNSALQIEHILETRFSQQAHRLRTTLAAVAVHDRQSRPIQFIQSIWQFT